MSSHDSVHCENYPACIKDENCGCIPSWDEKLAAPSPEPLASLYPELGNQGGAGEKEERCTRYGCTRAATAHLVITTCDEHFDDAKRMCGPAAYLGEPTAGDFAWELAQGLPQTHPPTQAKPGDVDYAPPPVGALPQEVEDGIRALDEAAFKGGCRWMQHLRDNSQHFPADDASSKAEAALRRSILQAIDAARAEERDETAWMIEAAPITAHPLYWDGTDWTPDHMRGVRFARQVDGERIAESFLSPNAYQITGHTWYRAALSPQRSDPHGR